MTAPRTTLALLLFAILLTACTAARQTSSVDVSQSACGTTRVDAFTDNTTTARLVTAGYDLYPPACHRQALEEVLAQRDPATGRPRPFLFFIHGLGKHPARAWKERLLTRLEQQHGVAVVMMTWPSWNGYGRLADEQARQSAGGLLAILEVLAKLKETQPAERPFTLLTHSSGSLIVEELVRRYPDKQPGRLFDAMVLSAPVSQIDRHRQWFEKLTLAGRIYSVSNRNDFALRCLESDLQAFGICDENVDSVLGRLDSDTIESGMLSTDAVYLDLSDALNSKHRYYIHGNRFDPAKHVSTLYSAMLRGERAELAALKPVIPGRLYRY